MHDVYAYGVIAPSNLIELVDEFPAAGGYGEIAGVHPSLGGEAASGAYVLARLGVATKLAGNRLGGDAASARVIDLLSGVGVDCSAVDVSAATTPVTEVVIAGGSARTVLGTYRQLASDHAWSAPVEEDVRSSAMVCLDPFFGEASAQVADWCIDAGLPYVTVDVAPGSRIAQHADVVVVSQEFAIGQMGATGEISEARRLLIEYTEQCRGLTILTRGHDRLLSGRRHEPPREHLPIVVEARDTTGAGDSFRAGIVDGLLRGLDDDRLIRTASALAALVCTTLPGVLNSPTRRELDDFVSTLGDGVLR